MAGISTRREEGVECCYARQTKFWVNDPDGNMWEVYTLEEDLEHRGDGRLPVIDLTKNEAGRPAESIWSHRLGSPFPAQLPILDGTVDRVMLEGTLNERISLDEQKRRLAEIKRVLRPGGRVELHMLTSNQPIGDQPLSLPGPAAAVKAVPEESAVLALLTETGFCNAALTFRGAHAFFKIDACELRETRFAAAAP
jgi:hypothetical protein